jgi:ATP-binding cassette subfamily C protein
LFDLPWMPIYLAFIYFLHPLLGALTFAGAFVLTVLTVVSEVLTKRLSLDTRKAAMARNTIADSNARNAEVLKAMGFAGRAVTRFNVANGEHLELQTRANDITGTFAAVSRVLRMLLQSAVLGLGAYLTIKGELSAGAIIACSVASARALAPVDLAIGNWKAFIAARMAYHRLRDTVVALASVDEPMQLPVPKHRLSVEKATIAVPGSGQIVLSDISFELEAGQALGVIGPSAGGKTTLVRALTGIWPLLRGNVRLDGADLSQWRDDEIGRYVGYLPQEVSLMDATIEENICRFEPQPDYRKVVEAAQAAGVHEMIVKMPEGYRTQLGPQGSALSAGQRQRVALARALYGNPFIVVMDEPNSNLDGEGEAALTAAIEGISARGGITVVIAHRPSALVAVDLVAIVQSGKMVAFGKKQDIMTPGLQASPRPAAEEPQVQMRRPA